MSPLEAAQTAHQIATREHLPLARIAELEAGAAGAVTWFAANILRFFEAEAAAVADSLTSAQFRRYIAWMRFNR
ncbi:MAG: hypothetical protein JSR55_03135 [Proteobacteria bacterium]|nr:hypothetical protein [Pseudomonadota bacterium]